MLLYALPLTRITRLRASDCESADGADAVRIGDDLVPVSLCWPLWVKDSSSDHATSAAQDIPNATGSFPDVERTPHRAQPPRRTTEPTRCRQSGAHRRVRRPTRHRARTGSGQAHRPHALARGSTNETPEDRLEKLRRPASTVMNISGRNTRRNEYASPPVRVVG